MENLQYCRLVLLAKEGMNLQVMNEWMDPQIASLWVKIGGKGVRNLYVGGVYREHNLLNPEGQNENVNDDPISQELRWKKFIQQWIKASDAGPCIIIGDNNLDKKQVVCP